MIFQIVAMICVAGMQPQDCAPEVGHSRDVAIVGEVTNEIMCGIHGIVVFPESRSGRVYQDHVRSKGMRMA